METTSPKLPWLCHPRLPMPLPKSLPPLSATSESVGKDFGKIDILVHSLANGPEVTKPLLETSRRGYLAASSASAYSYISLLSVRRSAQIIHMLG